MTASMTSGTPNLEPVVFLPGARGEDVLARYWLRQVMLRLRREICWLWHERQPQAGSHVGGGMLPPFADRAVGALDLMRYERDKQAFFAEDVTARHLSDLIAAAPPSPVHAVRGSFTWVVQALELASVERFVLAMALLPALDSAAGSVFATCLNDPTRNEPTLALAQRLWDEPNDLVRCFDPAHALLRHGLLALAPGGWHTPLAVPALVARELLFPGTELPAALKAVSPSSADDAPSALAVARAGVRPSRGMRVVPLIGAIGTPLAGVAAACAASGGLNVVEPSTAVSRADLAQVLTTAWLRDSAVYFSATWLLDEGGHDALPQPLPLPTLPVTVFVGLDDTALLKRLRAATLPPIAVAPLSFTERLTCWRRALPSVAHQPILAEMARRFRYEQNAIARVGDELAALERPPTADELFAAARADLDLGTLAQAVVPRFSLAELMLPQAQEHQIDEIVAAMTNLTRVHYEWGTAQAWSESGLTALFSGPPGTGKTMAAEAIAHALVLPMYRIDLSQVVNKYIGETEKNLRRLFDAADSADVILFFDEADALFGKRTEVKDAHDRYANLEISYLLERMERFKGLAILATNRKKDLDEAFLRRLRFAVEFPLPGVAERKRIWDSVIPPSVDVSRLDFDFLAQRFALAGGHIRSIVFQACLQSAASDAPLALGMPAVIRAVQREYQKLDRVCTLDQFGRYAPLLSAEGTKT